MPDVAVAEAAPAYEALGSKYYVAHSATPYTRIAEDIFVLRPERDRAARKALLAYAQACEDRELRADLFEWLAHIARGEARGTIEPYQFRVPPEVLAALERGQQDPDDGFDPLGAGPTLPAEPPYGARLQICSCTAQFFFGKIRRADGTYSNTPINWPPAYGVGHLAVSDDSPVDGKLAVRQTTKAEREAAYGRYELLWTAHFSTCPDAAQHRGGRG